MTTCIQCNISASHRSFCFTKLIVSSEKIGLLRKKTVTSNIQTTQKSGSTATRWTSYNDQRSPKSSILLRISGDNWLVLFTQMENSTESRRARNCSDTGLGWTLLDVHKSLYKSIPNRLVSVIKKYGRLTDY